jgi:hypothetical protein
MAQLNQFARALLMQEIMLNDIFFYYETTFTKATGQEINAYTPDQVFDLFEDPFGTLYGTVIKHSCSPENFEFLGGYLSGLRRMFTHEIYRLNRTDPLTSPLRYGQLHILYLIDRYKIDALYQRIYHELRQEFKKHPKLATEGGFLKHDFDDILANPNKLLPASLIPAAPKEDLLVVVSSPEKHAEPSAKSSKKTRHTKTTKASSRAAKKLDRILARVSEVDGTAALAEALELSAEDFEKQSAIVDVIHDAPHAESSTAPTHTPHTYTTAEFIELFAHANYDIRVSNWFMDSARELIYYKKTTPFFGLIHAGLTDHDLITDHLLPLCLNTEAFLRYAYFDTVARKRYIDPDFVELPRCFFVGQIEDHGTVRRGIFSESMGSDGLIYHRSFSKHYPIETDIPQLPAYVWDRLPTAADTAITQTVLLPGLAIEQQYEIRENEYGIRITPCTGTETSPISYTIVKLNRTTSPKRG